VRFGTSVTIVRDDGRKQTFRIVGEDETDPAHGSISYVSPLDVVRAGAGEAEIIRPDRVTRQNYRRLKSLAAELPTMRQTFDASDHR
jgi:hypothetical protein